MIAPASAEQTAHVRAAFARLAAVPSSGDDGREGSIEWLHSLNAWIADGQHERRLAAVAAHLRTAPQDAARLRDLVRRLVVPTDALRLLTDAGMPTRIPIAEEVLVRIVRFFVPHAVDGGDLMDVVRRVAVGRSESEWFEHHEAHDIADFLDASGLTACGGFEGLWLQLAESVRIHSLRGAAIGLDADVRRATGRVPLAESPFHRLTAAAARLLDALTAAPPDAAAAAAARGEIEPALAAARAVRDDALAHLERSGVSADMVVRLEFLGRSLDRIEAALPLLAPRDGERIAPGVARVLHEVAAGVRREGSFVRSLGDRTRLLARSVLERCGATGSHYITSGRREWWDMARAGAGGGIVIGFVVWLKVAIHDLHPPPGALALLTFLDYAAGFLVIYAMHFALATKQPPMTAAALAEALASGREGRDMSPVVTLVQRICRSQVAGLIGNIVFTALTALTLDVIVHSVTGHGIVRADEAAVTLAGHQPFESLCLLFAVGTGTAVWLSSMASGWAENAARYGRLDDSVGEVRGGRVTAWIVRNIGGVTGNLSLAFLLVLMTFGGGVTGIPWDVRHVTVSTGQVTLALIATDGMNLSAAAWPVAGVLLVGALNVVTGFALSFLVATRAIRTRVRLRFLPALAASILRRPWLFLLPVEDDAPPAAH
jgi:site-specific recombinase